MKPARIQIRDARPIPLLLAFGAIAAISLRIPGVCRAADQPASVSATGHATLKKRPDILRAAIVLQSHGKDVAEAISKLHQLRDQTKTKLTTAGAAEASIQFSDPENGAGGAMTPQQRQMQMMQDMQRGNRKPAAPQGVTLSCTVTAEWPFTAASPDEALVLAAALQEKIKGALPAATGEKKALTPEEQELAEEAAAQNNGGDPGPKPGEPSFVYVYKLTDADKAKLRADAFASAKNQAGNLAAAAGKSLGPVHEISSGAIPAQSDNPYANYMAMMNGGGDASGQPNEDTSEATGATPTSVSYALNVSASFALQ